MSNGDMKVPVDGSKQPPEFPFASSSRIEKNYTNKTSLLFFYRTGTATQISIPQ